MDFLKDDSEFLVFMFFSIVWGRTIQFFTERFSKITWTVKATLKGDFSNGIVRRFKQEKTLKII